MRNVLSGIPTKCPISLEDKIGALSTGTGGSLLQAINTTLEFMTRLVCRGLGGAGVGGENGNGVSL